MLLLVLVIWMTVSRSSSRSRSAVQRTLGNTSTDPLTSIETSARVTEANAKTLTSTPQRPHTQRIPSALLITRLLSWRRRIPTLLSRLFGQLRLHYVLSFAQTSPPRTTPAGGKLPPVTRRSIGCPAEKGEVCCKIEEGSRRALSGRPPLVVLGGTFLDPRRWPLVRQPPHFSLVRSGCKPNKAVAPESEALQEDP